MLSVMATVSNAGDITIAAGASATFDNDVSVTAMGRIPFPASSATSFQGNLNITAGEISFPVPLDASNRSLPTFSSTSELVFASSTVDGMTILPTLILDIDNVMFPLGMITLLDVSTRVAGTLTDANFDFATSPNINLNFVRRPINDFSITGGGVVLNINSSVISINDDVNDGTSARGLQNVLQYFVINPSDGLDWELIQSIELTEVIGNDASITAVDNGVLIPVNADSTFTGQANSITLTSSDTNNFTISAQAGMNYRGLFVVGSEMNGIPEGMLSIQNITFSGLTAKGGDGSLGGAGLGAGGALYIASGAEVTLANVTFQSCRALGGSITTLAGSSGGASINLPVMNDTTFMGVTGGFGFGGAPSGSFGGGAGHDSDGTALGTDFNGAAGVARGNGVGGNGSLLDSDGGYYAGGGSGSGLGGAGGFGGGGGYGGASGIGGSGGFGGGGAASGMTQGSSGFGGGSASTTEGGPGAGLGGAIFIEQGGRLILNDMITFGASNSATGGMSIDGSVMGSGLGQDIFMMTGSLLTVNSDDDITIPSAIEGNQGNQGGVMTPVDFSTTSVGGLTKEGSGTLALSGANTYSGDTNVNEGILTFGASASVSSPITIASGASLDLTLPFSILNTAMEGSNFPAIDGSLNVNGGDVNILGGSGTFRVEGAFNHASGTLELPVTGSGNTWSSSSISVDGTNAGNMFEGNLHFVLPMSFPLASNPSITLDITSRTTTSPAFVPAYSNRTISAEVDGMTIVVFPRRTGNMVILNSENVPVTSDSRLQEALFHLLSLDISLMGDLRLGSDIVLSDNLSNAIPDGDSASFQTIDNPILIPVNSDESFNPINRSVTISGSDTSGNAVERMLSAPSNMNYRGFFVRGGNATFRNINFDSLTAKGGDGTSGGGGLGSGGAIHIARDTTVVCDNVMFTNCMAVGGNLPGAGGLIGGGSINLPANGVVNNMGLDFYSGSGFGGLGSTMTTGSSLGGGAGRSDRIDFGGNTQDPEHPGTGGTGVASIAGNGGDGGRYGGGGGVVSSTATSGVVTAGSGGFGGGGGGAIFENNTHSIVCGNGGFGAGGGGAVSFISETNLDTPGIGGYGGGTGIQSAYVLRPDAVITSFSGGGGAGFGGALFLERGAMLTLSGSITFTGNSVTGGRLSTSVETSFDGSSAGADIFMMTGSSLTVDSTEDIALSAPIAGNQGNQTGVPAGDERAAFTESNVGGLIKRGTGTLTLCGANTYSGSTTISEGTLAVASTALETASIASPVTVESAGIFLAQEPVTIHTTPALTATTEYPAFPSFVGDLHIDGGEVRVEGASTSLTVDGVFNQSSGKLSLELVIVNLAWTTPEIVIDTTLTDPNTGNMFLGDLNLIASEVFLAANNPVITLNFNNNTFTPPYPNIRITAEDSSGMPLSIFPRRTGNMLFLNAGSIAISDVSSLQLSLNDLIRSDPAPATLQLADITLSDSLSANTVDPNGNAINFIDVDVPLPVNANTDFSEASTKTVTIESRSGSGNSLMGSTTMNYRGFFVRGGSATFQDISFENLTAKGGHGGLGGAGVGAGGALYLSSGAMVTIANSTFSNCRAIGGDTTGSGYIGGASVNAPLVAITSTRGSGFGGIPTTAGPGGASMDGGADFGGVDFMGTSDATALPNPSGRGGRESSADTMYDVNGGRYAGGALDTTAMLVGIGGFGGGGAHSNLSTGTDGGAGGFGGGGGSSVSGSGGMGGFGAGDGRSMSSDLGSGGAGAALGGAIFMEHSSSLTINGSAVFDRTMANSATGGVGITYTENGMTLSTSGMAFGQDIFMTSGASIIVDSSDTITIGTPIEGNLGDFSGLNSSEVVPDSTTGGLTKRGVGTLTLTGNNTYSGSTSITGGTLNIVDASDNTSSIVTPISIATGATLVVMGNFTVMSLAQVGSFAAYSSGINLSGGTLSLPGSAYNDLSMLTVEGAFNHASGAIALDLFSDDTMFYLPQITFNENAISNMFDGTISIFVSGSPTAILVTDSFDLNFKESDGTTAFVPTTGSGSSIMGYGSGDISISVPNSDPANDPVVLTNPSVTKAISSNRVMLNVDSVRLNAAASSVERNVPFSLDIRAGRLTVTASDSASGFIFTGTHDLTISGSTAELFLDNGGTFNDVNLTVGGAFTHSMGTLILRVTEDTTASSRTYVTNELMLQTTGNTFDGNLVLRIPSDFNAFDTTNVTIRSNDGTNPVIVGYDMFSAECPVPCPINLNTPSLLGTVDAVSGDLTSNEVMLSINYVDVTRDVTLNALTLPFGINVSSMTTSLTGANTLEGSYGLSFTGGNVTLSSGASLDITTGPFSHTGGTLTLGVVSSTDNGMTTLDADTITILASQLSSSSFTGMLALNLPAAVNVLLTRDIMLNFMQEATDGMLSSITSTYTVSNITVTSSPGITVNSSNPITLNNDVVTLNIDAAIINSNADLSGSYDFDIDIRGGITSVTSSSSITGTSEVGSITTPNGLAISGGELAFSNTTDSLTLTGAFRHSSGILSLQVDSALLTNPIIIRDTAATNTFGGTLDLVLPADFDPYGTRTVTLNFSEGADGSLVDIAPNYTTVTIDTTNIPPEIVATTATVTGRSALVNVTAAPPLTAGRSLNTDLPFAVVVNAPDDDTIDGTASITTGGLMLNSSMWTVSGSITGDVATAGASIFSGGNITGDVTIAGTGSFNAPATVSGAVTIGGTSTFNAQATNVSGLTTINSGTMFNADNSAQGGGTFAGINAASGSTLSLQVSLGGVGQMPIMIGSTDTFSLESGSTLDIFVPEGLYISGSIPLVNGMVSIARPGGNTVVADGSYNFQTAGDITVNVRTDITNSADATAFLNGLNYTITGGSILFRIGSGNVSFDADVYIDEAAVDANDRLGLQNLLERLIQFPSTVAQNIDVVASFTLTDAISATTANSNITTIDNPILLPVNATSSFGAHNGEFLLEAIDIANSSVFYLSGNGTYRGFYVRGGMFTLDDIELRMLRAKGGSSTVGGGGLGAGGALYVANGATVTLENVTIDGCTAVGGTTSNSGSVVGGASINLPVEEDKTSFTNVSGGIRLWR